MIHPTIGTDPEFFLVDRQKGLTISAHGLVPGDKTNPHKLNKGACQLDGVAVEFNTDPAKTAEEFATNIETVLKQLRNMIDKRYSFSFSPYAWFSDSYFRTVPAKHKQLGCDPDFISSNGCIGELSTMQRPDLVNNYRTGSGHVHVGWTQGADVSSHEHQTDCVLASRIMYLVTEPIRKIWDADTIRHRMYGDQGAYRPKPYGVEYRGLSNAWLRYPDLYPFIFTLFEKIFLDLQDENSPINNPEKITDFRRNCSNRGARLAASTLLGIKVPELGYARKM